jgi:hypothetical protein
MKRQKLFKKSNNIKKITKIPHQRGIRPISGRTLFINLKMKEGDSRALA